MSHIGRAIFNRVQFTFSVGNHICDLDICVVCKNARLVLPQMRSMITQCDDRDFNTIYEIINDSASAYRNVIPADRWHEPYMTAGELKKQIDEGVQFWSYREDDIISGIMGFQVKGGVSLIRHAYVRTYRKNSGVGSQLLKYLSALSTTPILVGTWAAADWAIRFYQKHEFHIVPEKQKNDLLRRYWNIPERQIETSVVLASKDWKGDE
jgi:N-acetylglutamate synthase-like GNAT family acetyltransferase